jgi:hypothetical protein
MKVVFTPPGYAVKVRSSLVSRLHRSGRPCPLQPQHRLRVAFICAPAACMPCFLMVPAASPAFSRGERGPPIHISCAGAPLTAHLVVVLLVAFVTSSVCFASSTSFGLRMLLLTPTLRLDLDAYQSADSLSYLSYPVVPVMLRSVSFALIVRGETAGDRHDRPGTRTPRALNVLRGDSILANTTTTTAPPTASGAHSTAPDIPGLFHPQHTALLVRAHLTFPLHCFFFFSTIADASPVARIHHAQLTATRTASGIRKAPRGRLTAAQAGTADAGSEESTHSAPFAARGTSVLSAVRDCQAPEDTSLSSVRHGTSPFLSRGWVMGS